MYSGYIRIVQIEEERVWIFSAEICTLNVHPRRISVFFVDIPLWSCFVLLSWCVSFQFNFAIPFYSVMIVTPVHLFSALSFQFCTLNFAFDNNFEILPLSANCKFNAFIFICSFHFLPWISTFQLGWHPLQYFN